MGTWGEGLWDGDAQLDAMGDFTYEVWTKIDALSKAPVNATNAARLAAFVGVLLQLSETYELTQESRHDSLMAALARQAPASTALSESCRRIMRRVAAGEGTALAARYGRRKGKLLTILGGYLDGLRVPELFEHPAAVKAVQELVDVAADQLEEELEPDLYEAAGPLALFGLILILEPAYVKPSRLKAWERVIEEASADALASLDGDFWKRYLKNVREAFKLGHARFASKPAARKAPPAAKAPRDLTPWTHLRAGQPRDARFASLARHGRGYTEHAGAIGEIGKERRRWFATHNDAQHALELRLAELRAEGFVDSVYDEAEFDGWVQAHIERERARRKQAKS